MYGLIIKKRWLDLIMSGKKTLEIRGCRTSHVGEEIALLESGSQKIRGFCTIKEVMDLDKGKWEVHRDRHCVDVPWENLIKRYKTPYAWHLSAITPKEGLTYEHPKGAVIWVTMPSKMQRIHPFPMVRDCFLLTRKKPVFQIGMNLALEITGKF